MGHEGCGFLMVLQEKKVAKVCAGLDLSAFRVY